MRRCLVVIALLAACKEKQEAKPQPAPAQPPAVAQPTPPPALPAEPDAKPVDAKPVEIKPAGGFTTAEQYETKAFELMDKLTNAFLTAGTNCEKLADNLDVFVDEHKATFDNTAAFATANPTVEDTLERKMKERSRKFLAHVNASMQACQKHDRVKAALAKLPK